MYNKKIVFFRNLNNKTFKSSVDVDDEDAQGGNPIK